MSLLQVNSQPSSAKVISLEGRVVNSMRKIKKYLKKDNSRKTIDECLKILDKIKQEISRDINSRDDDWNAILSKLNDIGMKFPSMEPSWVRPCIKSIETIENFFEQNKNFNKIGKFSKKMDKFLKIVDKLEKKINQAANSNLENKIDIDQRSALDCHMNKGLNDRILKELDTLKEGLSQMAPIGGYVSTNVKNVIKLLESYKLDNNNNMSPKIDESLQILNQIETKADKHSRDLNTSRGLVLNKLEIIKEELLSVTSMERFITTVMNEITESLKKDNDLKTLKSVQKTVSNAICDIADTKILDSSIYSAWLDKLHLLRYHLNCMVAIKQFNEKYLRECFRVIRELNKKYKQCGWNYCKLVPKNVRYLDCMGIIQKSANNNLCHGYEILEQISEEAELVFGEVPERVDDSACMTFIKKFNEKNLTKCYEIIHEIRQEANPGLNQVLTELQGLEDELSPKMSYNELAKTKAEDITALLKKDQSLETIDKCLEIINDMNSKVNELENKENRSGKDCNKYWGFVQSSESQRLMNLKKELCLKVPYLERRAKQCIEKIKQDLKKDNSLNKIRQCLEEIDDVIEDIGRCPRKVKILELNILTDIKEKLSSAINQRQEMQKYIMSTSLQRYCSKDHGLYQWRASNQSNNQQLHFHGQKLLLAEILIDFLENGKLKDKNINEFEKIYCHGNRNTQFNQRDINSLKLPRGDSPYQKSLNQLALLYTQAERTRMFRAPCSSSEAKKFIDDTTEIFKSSPLLLIK